LAAGSTLNGRFREPNSRKPLGVENSGGESCLCVFSFRPERRHWPGLVRRNREVELETSGVKEIERKRGTTPNPRGINAQSTFLQLYNTFDLLSVGSRISLIL